MDLTLAPFRKTFSQLVVDSLVCFLITGAFENDHFQMRQIMRSMRFNILTIVVCLGLAMPAISQSKTTISETKPINFDVVSIRLSNGARGQGVNVTSDSYEAFGLPLETTLLIAYARPPFIMHRDEVKGFPSWVSNDRYDIQAKVAPMDVERWRGLNENVMRASPTLQQMLQALLAERCKLRIHNGETMTIGYALSIEPKKPLRLREDSSLPAGQQGLELLDGARAVISMEKGEEIYTFYNTSMPVFANFLSLTSKQAVEDRTGLRGRYKFSLRHITSTASAENIGSDVDIAMPWDLRTLGLKTNKEKVPTKVWVVDSIERPSPN